VGSDIVSETMPKTLFFTNYNRGPITSLDCARGVACFEDCHAYYTGVNCPGSPMQHLMCSNDWPSLKDAVAKKFGDSNPTESDYAPGTAYKRIAWPVLGKANLLSTIDLATRTQSFVALRLLLSKMVDIFETIEPAPQNLDTYGHKVRELLLMASMEAETSWAAVLKANGYGADGHLKTWDYVKLLDPMLLDSYSLTLASYPNFPSFAPLRDWDSSRPTQSLPWYDAYNATKHNREENLKEATMERAIHAVGAAVVMFYAQFGDTAAVGDERLSFIASIFKKEFDLGRHPYCYYIPRVAFRRGSTNWDWTLLDYPSFS
jgi:hypothetical protein